VTAPNNQRLGRSSSPNDPFSGTLFSQGFTSEVGLYASGQATEPILYEIFVKSLEWVSGLRVANVDEPSRSVMKSRHHARREIVVVDGSRAGGLRPGAPHYHYDPFLRIDIEELAKDSLRFESTLMDWIGAGAEGPPHVAVVLQLA
jgi:hypothetical protein